MPPTSFAASPREAEKAFATAVARAALAGFELRRTTDAAGHQAFQVTRWNLCRVLPDLAAVDAFIGRAAGTRAGNR